MGTQPHEQAARQLIDEWRAKGSNVLTPEGNVFVIDTGDPMIATGERPDEHRGAVLGSGNPPLVIIHGFPTSSFDFVGVVDRLSADRRVILFDQIGFGLSDKPDRRYGIQLHADTTEAVLDSLGINEFDLLTHDMGDSVGGELLARYLERDSSPTVNRRVVTNGSIYLHLAQLTLGQQVLMSLPDESTDELPVDAFVNGVIATFAADSDIDSTESLAHGLVAQANGGLCLMARLIRYLEDRKAYESRYTGAIEAHPAPLHIVWGDLDPVAVAAMAGRLGERTKLAGNTNVTTDILDGVGHYPMIEAPERFAEAVLRGLN